jgi:hypothetical protein
LELTFFCKESKINLKYTKGVAAAVATAAATAEMKYRQ